MRDSLSSFKENRQVKKRPALLETEYTMCIHCCHRLKDSLLFTCHSVRTRTTNTHVTVWCESAVTANLEYCGVYEASTNSMLEYKKLLRRVMSKRQIDFLVMRMMFSSLIVRINIQFIFGDLNFNIFKNRIS